MLELNASNFLNAATNLARVHQIFSGLDRAYGEILVPSSVELIIPPLADFKRESDQLGARLASIAADRMLSKLRLEPCVLNVGQAVLALNEIESRFADYLTEVKMFVLYPQEASFLETADQLVESEGFSAMFPNAALEVEEASKCIALGRFTASVFHSMRMLEIAIRALAKRLGIPDPTAPAEKNWGKILEAIKTKIDATSPKKNRMPGSEGSFFEDLYAHLDAVRNPWRNATMHVETIYMPHEALHILRCSAFFVRRLSKITDEVGNPPISAPSPDLIAE